MHSAVDISVLNDPLVPDRWRKAALSCGANQRIGEPHRIACSRCWFDHPAYDTCQGSSQPVAALGRRLDSLAFSAADCIRGVHRSGK